jgi:hypothetical protein
LKGQYSYSSFRSKADKQDLLAGNGKFSIDAIEIYTVHESF